MSQKLVLNVYPMHGYHKWLSEGYRTRDAHITEWSAQLLSGSHCINVQSRPDPFPVRTLALRKVQVRNPLDNTLDSYRNILRIPPIIQKKRWWVNSVKYYRDMQQDTPLLIWNPMLGMHRDLSSHRGPVHVDLLDNWLVHAAFESFRTEIEASYEQLFRSATSITANSESTLKLAQDHGRHDAVLLPNGCDPERFSTHSNATGRVTIGYVGKIGQRLDTDLILEVARSNPEWRFVFAGPVLEKEVGDALRGVRNIDMLGDVHYSNVPELLQQFDVGWVPHGVEKGQVGGDAIKIYEYRAAGLPVVTTPIIGTRERPMQGVHVAEAFEHSNVLRSLRRDGERIPRMPYGVPEELTWKHKASVILGMIGLTH